MTRSMVLGTVLVGLAGCGGWDQESKYLERLVDGRATTGADGLAKIRIPLPDNFNVTKGLFRFDAVEDGQTVYVDRVETEDGTPLRRFLSEIDVDERPTGAVISTRYNHFNWPIDAGDAEISGDRLVVVVGAVGADQEFLSAGSRIDVSGLLTDDADFTVGELKVVLHWTAGLEKDANLRADVELGVAKMQAIYAEYGVAVTVENRTEDEDPSLAEGAIGRPGFASPERWDAISASTDDIALDLVIVDTIAGTDTAVLGAAGSIPGGILPSERSGLIISTSANAGPDLVFSDDEIDLLGATMAHELGHMLGLFHPVETTYEVWDAVDDTEKCKGAGACQGQLGDNLMYPTALCTTDSCLTQETLTEGQVEILHRYVGVN